MANMQIVAAGGCKNVEAQYVELMVPLYSHGCERKVKKAFSQLKGIYSVNVDYNQQKVTVWGICNKYDVLDTIKNKRKDARFWNLEDNNIFLLDQNSQSSSPPSSPNPPANNLNKNHKYSKHYLTLIRAQSFKWTSLKKVFSRSYSF